MIRSIQRLRDFGVFRDFRKTAATSDFAMKNIIYGWNYSGKTTLSRLFASVGQGRPYRECPSAIFELHTTDERTINETLLAAANLKIEVFNSDFVVDNLSWNGDAFEPILLLGDAVEAEKELEKLQGRLTVCRRKWQEAKSTIDAIDRALADAKTKAARDTKQTLQIVEAFTATHLTSEIERLPAERYEALLDESTYQADMLLALAKEQDRPKLVQPISPPILELSNLTQNLEARLAYIPAVSRALDHLRTHSDIASWVEKGLALHQETRKCEFCEGVLTEGRLAELRGHFSTDLSKHRNEVNALAAQIKQRYVGKQWLNPPAFVNSFQTNAATLQRRIEYLSDQYNDELRALVEAASKKIESPFTEESVPAVFPSVGPLLSELFSSAEDLIRRNNAEISQFSDHKRAAIRRLKAHFAAKFCLDDGRAEQARTRARLARFQRRLAPVGKKIAAEIDVLHARVNRAQKGRERLNQRIVNLLGSDVLQIEVVSVTGQDRFTLRRNGSPARNLSDGERTAIAFAFFLTKLEEHGSLDDVIVYIDDPISSLDSNHVFQVFSTIEATLFKKIAHNGGAKWVTSCRQLFVSTHNFEFFEMLKRLPVTKADTRYFLVKKIGVQESIILDLPESLRRYRSEYHYLFSVIRQFHESETKSDIAQLLALPNAIRRFLELYTYMRLPWPESTVEQRLAALISSERSARITKLLHHFSHLESVDRLATHTNVIADIEAVAGEVMELLRSDAPHMDALLKEEAA